MSSVLSSKARVSKAKENLWVAERLALFANADDRAAIENFRANNPEFLPPAVWSNASEPIPGEKGFDEMLFGSGIKPCYWFGLREALRSAWKDGFTPEYCVILLSFAGDMPLNPSAEVWPFQRAVMFLAMKPWQAKFCGVCGKRFVADKPATRFCSTACADRARKASRNDWWKEHGKDWRKRAKTKRGKQRAKR